MKNAECDGVRAGGSSELQSRQNRLFSKKTIRGQVVNDVREHQQEKIDKLGFIKIKSLCSLKDGSKSAQGKPRLGKNIHNTYFQERTCP